MAVNLCVRFPRAVAQIPRRGNFKPEYITRTIYNIVHVFVINVKEDE